MKISQLAVSPAAMFVKGVREDAIRKHSQYYQLDKKVVDNICKSLEFFLPELVFQFKKTPSSSISSLQWLVLTKSIIHSFVAMLFALETVKRAKKLTYLDDDIDTYHHFFPQTQEQLMTRLSFDKGSHDALFSIALSMIQDKPIDKIFSASLLDTYSPKNMGYYLAKKRFVWMAEKVKFVKDDTKKTVLVLSADNVIKHFNKKILKNFQLVDLDIFIQSLYRFPKLPDRKKRQKLAAELAVHLKKARIEKYFPFFNNKNSIETIAITISNLLPITLVEDFEWYHSRIKAKLKEVGPDSVITSAGHHQEFANLCLARTYRQGIPLSTFQHGSSYAEFKSMQSERTIETALYRTTYYSWGKNFSACQGAQNITKVKTVGSPYLQKLPKLGFNAKRIRKVLIPLDPIYYYQVLESFIPTPPGFVHEQYGVVVGFIKHIAKKYPHLKIIIKTKIGHTNQLSVKRFFSEIELNAIEFTEKGRTYDYFDNETLIFCPILSGAFNEAIIAQIPFIVYAPEPQSYFRKQVDTIIKQLSLHSSAGFSLSQLKKAFQEHYQKKVNYKKLAVVGEKYCDLVCLQKQPVNISFN